MAFKVFNNILIIVAGAAILSGCTTATRETKAVVAPPTNGQRQSNVAFSADGGTLRWTTSTGYSMEATVADCKVTALSGYGDSKVVGRVNFRQNAE